MNYEIRFECFIKLNNIYPCETPNYGYNCIMIITKFFLKSITDVENTGFKCKIMIYIEM